MKDVIIQYVVDYIPVILMLVMMFIDRYGFGNLFHDFRNKIISDLNAKKMIEEFESMKAAFRAVMDENQAMREEIQKLNQSISRIRRK